MMNYVLFIKSSQIFKFLDVKIKSIIKKNYLYRQIMGLYCLHRKWMVPFSLILKK